MIRGGRKKERERETRADKGLTASCTIVHHSPLAINLYHGTIALANLLRRPNPCSYAEYPALN